MNIVVSVNRPLLHQSSPLFVYSYFQNDTRAIQKLQKYRYQNIFEATAMQTVPLSRIEKTKCYTNNAIQTFIIPIVNYSRKSQSCLH